MTTHNKSTDQETRLEMLLSQLHESRKTVHNHSNILSPPAMRSVFGLFVKTFMDTPSWHNMETNLKNIAHRTRDPSLTSTAAVADLANMLSKNMSDACAVVEAVSDIASQTRNPKIVMDVVRVVKAAYLKDNDSSVALAVAKTNKSIIHESMKALRERITSMPLSEHLRGKEPKP